VPDAEPRPAERPEFFEQVLGDEADSTRRKAAKRPWWLLAGPERHHGKMACVYFVMAVAAFAAYLLGVPGPVAWMFAIFWLLMSAWFVSAVAWRRRGRGRTDATRDPGPPGSET
jgi:hypothetical protein